MAFKIPKTVYAIATLTGTIVGVGFFSLPYITSQVGLRAMAVYFLFLGSFVLLIHLLYADVALATADFLRLPGYAKLHLGEWAKKLALFFLICGSFGSLLAYLIVGGEFLRGLFFNLFGGNVAYYTLLYFALGAVAILVGVRAIAKIEFWGMILFFCVLALLLVKGAVFFKLANLSLGAPSVKNIFLPFGPIIFSLWGATMVPEIEEMMGKNKGDLKKVILISLFVAAFIYAVFTVFIFGITGSQTSESALTGLSAFLGKEASIIGFIFGFLATFTSFIAIGLYLKNMFHYDFKIPKTLSWFLVCSPPLFLFLIGLKNFITVIGFVGAVMLGVEGILVLLMYLKIKTKIL